MLHRPGRLASNNKIQGSESMPRLQSSAIALLAGFACSHAAPAAADPAGATITTGDLMDTGQPAIVIVSAAGDINVLTPNSDGSFDVSVYTPGDLAAPTSVAVADVNADGWPDVIITDSGDAGAGVRVFLNNGDGTLAGETIYASGTAGTRGPASLAVADVNGDGWPDIVTANGKDDSVSLLPNAGDGTFGAPLGYPAGPDAAAVAVADMNGDGFADILTTNLGDDSVSVLLSDGAGGFAVPLGQAVGAGPVGMVLADVNGDGHPDVMVANRDDDNAGVLLGHGDGSFEPTAFYATGSAPSWITAQDVNGDGRADIVTDNFDDGSVSMLTNKGDGTFAPQQQVYPDYGSDNTVVMDINGNGSPDVVSVDLQVASVVVIPTLQSGGQTGGTVHHINGGHSPNSDTSGGGALGLFSLSLLAAALIRRRRATSA
jgi:hypothetical protein